MFKLEVEKDGEFVTVYTRNLSTGVEVGGTITGEETGKVSDTTRAVISQQPKCGTNKIVFSSPLRYCETHAG
jgi:hypothetical protein